MVTNSESTVKQDAIIEAAIRRFSHFGVNKTTLSEIAGDLNISKPLLFYYFNDKESLILAVFEKLVTDFHEEFKKKFSDQTTAEEAVLMFVDSKRDALKKNLQLALQASGVEINQSSPKLRKIISQARNQTIQIISDIFKRDIQNNELATDNTRNTVRLILDTLHSFEFYMKRNLPFPETTDIDQLAQKQKEVVHLFFDGLKRGNKIRN